MKDAIYLAGPMEDTSKDDMCGWRETATHFCSFRDIRTLDPTRRVSFHDQLGTDTLLQDSLKSMNVCKRIFKQDLQDISDSRVVVADVRRQTGRGTGTSMELMFAHMKNKIIILWADNDDFIHPFYEAIYSEKHYNLKDAIEAAMEYC